MKSALHLMSRPIDPSGQFQEQFRRRFTMTLLIIGSVFLLSFAPVDYFAGLHALAIANVLFALFLLSAAAWMYISGRVHSVTRAAIAGFLIWFMVTIPTSVLVTIWFPVFPLVTFFGLGRREGMWWSGVFLLLVALEYLICRHMGIYIANDIFLASTLACLALVIVSVVYYQRLLELLQEAVSKQFQQLQHAQRLESIGVLAGGVAHDFNNLLVGIMGNVELLMLDETDHNQARKRQLGEMLKSAQRGADLVRQLLSFAGKGGWECGNIQLDAFLEEIRPAIASVAGAHAQLVINADSPLLPIEGDPKQLEQVLLNMVANAREATVAGRTCMIHIRTGIRQGTLPSSVVLDAMGEQQREGPLVYLRIEDNGRGMDADLLDKVFDPFFTTKEAGSGLGLAAVAGIMRSMSGAVEVQSRKGEGSAFILWFPAIGESQAIASDAAPGHKRAAKPAASLPALRGTVLLVDDEDVVRAVARKMLEAAGLRVMEAEDGATALRLLQEARQTVDLLVLDYTLPDMKGDRVYDIMLSRGTPLPTIICSGYGELADTLHVQRQKVLFVRKPFRMQELIAAAEQCLQGEGA